MWVVISLHLACMRRVMHCLLCHSWVGLLAQFSSLVRPDLCKEPRLAASKFAAIPICRQLRTHNLPRIWVINPASLFVAWFICKMLPKCTEFSGNKPLYMLTPCSGLLFLRLWFPTAAGGVCALYCNIKLAKLAVINGKRFVRFRDISNEVYGKALSCVLPSENACCIVQRS